MNEKAIDSRADGFLVLLLPIAFLIVFLFATWPVLLALVVLGACFNIWQRYQWQKWSQQVNPIFHRLIQENQGRITALDLAMKANFSAETAKRYLDSKAAEYGAQIQDEGTVYYFITSSTLGSIFNDSELAIEPSQKDVGQPSSVTSTNVKEQARQDVEPSSSPEIDLSRVESDSSVGVIEPKSHTPTDDNSQATNSMLENSDHQAHVEPLQQQNLAFKPLIQAELAKRFDVHSSTIYKRRDDPDFAEWSRSRDPEGIAWKFLPDTKEFLPLEEQKS